MTILETGNYIKQLFQIKICKEAVPLHRQGKDLASKHIPLLKMMMYNGILTQSEKWCLQFNG